uniref:Uncharacterized protein n=1 Tax=Candidatus Kentrum sp. FM TaxID=2126340 RepID=A0A450U0D3_9GAMM|nr:MAG: hypothetical protein BECKFM1743A_GA0114220_108711 [Candidatus Kentron sp. FM]
MVITLPLVGTVHLIPQQKDMPPPIDPESNESQDQNPRAERRWKSLRTTVVAHHNPAVTILLSSPSPALFTATTQNSNFLPCS